MTVTVVGSIVIDLGTSPAGTSIQRNQFGTYVADPGFPTNLPLPALPVGSILRSIMVNTVLEDTDNNNYASDLSVLLDPTPGTPGGDFSVEITNGTDPLGGGALALNWPSGNTPPVSPLTGTKTYADWSAAGEIDLNSTGLFLGNSYDSGTGTYGGKWSGTITLTYDVVGGSAYGTWAAGPFPSMLPLTDSTFTVDFDGGGLQTGIEWVVGGDPTDGSDDAGLAPTVSEDGTYLIFTYQRTDAANDDPNTAIKVEWDIDLQGAWTEAVVGDGVIINVTDLSPADTVEVKIPKSLAAPGNELYARLNVTITP